MSPDVPGGSLSSPVVLRYSPEGFADLDRAATAKTEREEMV